MQTTKPRSYTDRQFGELCIETTRYVNGYSMAVFLTKDGEHFAMLSVNMLGAPKLPPGHFYAKLYSENEPLRDGLIASGWFLDTGVRMPTGFATVEVWELLKERQMR